MTNTKADENFQKVFTAIGRTGKPEKKQPQPDDESIDELVEKIFNIGVEFEKMWGKVHHLSKKRGDAKETRKAEIRTLLQNNRVESRQPVDDELVEKTVVELTHCVDVGFSHTQDRSWGELDEKKAKKIIRTLLQSVKHESHRLSVTREEIQELIHIIGEFTIVGTRREDIDIWFKSRGIEVKEGK